LEGPLLHGYLAIVLPAIQKDEKVALKLSWTDEYSADEMSALEAWDGDGVVRLINTDKSLGALLLERLDYNTNLESLSPDDAILVAGDLLRRLAIPAPYWARSVESQCDELASRMEKMFSSLDHNIERSSLDKSLGLLKELRKSDDKLLVNSDLHFQNVLAGDREKWLVIDPKVSAGDLEFGTAQLVWQDFGMVKSSDEFSRRLELLADAANLDLQKMRGWIYIRVVDLWLWGVKLGFTGIPERCETLISYLNMSKLDSQ